MYSYENAVQGNWWLLKESAWGQGRWEGGGGGG